jgi:DNA-binding transcriptional MerR regulator
MFYTVKEVAELTGITVKTLYHYHKIGLLKPCRISQAGYRLYGTKELERLQQILFYRELEFSLQDIQKALEDEPGRQACLRNQYELLIARRQRLDCLLKTLEESILHAGKGIMMDNKAMFKGFNQEEWKNALSEQNKYLQEKYAYDMMAQNDIQADDLNEKAMEARQFLQSLAQALQNGWAITDERLHTLIENHLHFLNTHGIKIDAQSFVSQTRFFLEDDFHRNMLENQQPGLCYYLCLAAEKFASTN